MSDLIGSLHSVFDLKVALRAVPIGIAVIDRELRFVFCNDLLARRDGIPVESHLGRTIPELYPHLDPTLLDTIRTVADTGAPLEDYVLRGNAPFIDGADSVWLGSAIPLRDEAGRFEHILVSIQDVSELDRAQSDLAAHDEQFRLAQQMSPDPFMLLRAIRDDAGAVVDFEIEYANPVALANTGQASLAGKRLLQTFPGNARYPELFERFVRLLAARGADVVELGYADGGLNGWYRNSAVAIAPDRLAISYRDITVQKDLEEKLRVVADEYRHRLKNMFAVFGALLNQSAKSASDVDSLCSHVSGRLVAMATAQDLLSEKEGDRVALERLVRVVLAPFLAPQIAIEPGPQVWVSSSGIAAMALALHELATNAAKFGGLAHPEGQIRIGWRVRRGRVLFEWRERSPLPVSRVPSTGFGTKLIADVARHLHNGQVRRDFQPDGLVVTIGFDR